MRATVPSSRGQPAGASSAKRSASGRSDTHTGAATIATYTVLHGRDGNADWGLLVCDVGESTRCYARTSDGDTLAELESEECVGRSVDLLTDDKNVNQAGAIRA